MGRFNLCSLLAKSRSVDRKHRADHSLSCSRAPLEEMLQRAGVGANVRGPPVPEGPTGAAAPMAGEKPYGFTPLP
jgi:hypothetical protein